jgi:hypothetical protein
LPTVHLFSLHTIFNTVAPKPLKKGTSGMICGVNGCGRGVKFDRRRPHDNCRAGFLPQTGSGEHLFPSALKYKQSKVHGLSAVLSVRVSPGLQIGNTLILVSFLHEISRSRMGDGNARADLRVGWEGHRSYFAVATGTNGFFLSRG